MKKTPVTLLLCTLAFAGQTSAAFEGNLGVSSNYLWRGVSQTQDAVAMDGGLDYSHDSGFYAGFWASSVDFGDDTSYELDLYGGFNTELSADWTLDLGYLLYSYPDADADSNFGELYARIGWRWLTLGYAHFIHAGDDVAAEGLSKTDLDYLSADVALPLGDKLELGFHYGYSSGDVAQGWYGESSYSDYSASLTKGTDIGDISFIVADTSLDGDDTKLVLRWSYALAL